MKKILKEPLFHFLVIGALIFVVFSAFNKEEVSTGGKKIVVSSGDIERLAANWSKKWNRQPTEDELKGLVNSYIKEEVYYREALALGLDKDDSILRRRLMQKMEFLSNDLADLRQDPAGRVACETLEISTVRAYKQPIAHRKGGRTGTPARSNCTPGIGGSR